MGVASGRFVPTPAYASIRPFWIEHREHLGIDSDAHCLGSGPACESSAVGAFKSLTSVLNSAKQELKFISTVSPIRHSATCFHTMWKPIRNNSDSPDRSCYFCRLVHRACAAFRAFSLRCSPVSFLADVLPPLRPSSTAAGFFFLAMN
jgi:hypothetical protein